MYPDEAPEILADGSWTYRYAPESQTGRPGADLPTNQGLIHCMEDGVPIGVFRQVEDREGRRRYRVLGLGYVEAFDGHHFLIRGEPINESVRPMELGVIRPFVPLDPAPLPIEDVRRIRRERRFGVRIRSLYHEKCSLCEVGYRLRGRSLALEAAHIIPLDARGPIDDVRNGILLCSNHHALFDAFAWTFDTDYRVLVTPDRDFRASALANHLLQWEGERLPNLPKSVETYPAVEAIVWRKKEFEASPR
ncbi:MAG: HNH endonuclease [Thermoplasmata archaeon]